MLRAAGPIAILLGVSLLPPLAAADDVHLAGGNVIEGKATRQDDKVVVELDAGRITLSADAVERIDKRESNVQRFERKYSELKAEDVSARLALADYCRDHDMRARERMLLEQIIERDPNHAAARARLGYVRAELVKPAAAGPASQATRLPASGLVWITREEQLRAEGMVQRDGQWLTREQALEQDRLRAQAETAAHERERAQAALEAQRLELKKRQLELDSERARLEREQTSPPPAATPGYYYYGGYGYGVGRAGGHIGRGGYGHGHAPSAPTFPINGVRDPRADPWPMNGARNPRN